MLPTFSGNLAFAIFTNSLVINVFTLQPEVRLFGLDETLTWLERNVGLREIPIIPLLLLI